MALRSVALLLIQALAGSAAAIEKRAACSSYTLLNTRGTGEPQGESSGFRTMNANVMSQLPGGKLYNTVYPAGADQNSASGTRDIINHIQTTLASNPNECFILEGYSQGAAATDDALPSLTGNAFNAVKGVFLIGDPEHHSGLTCNVDNHGGTTTRNVNGIEAYKAGVPSNWVSKTLDVCILGDGVCDTRDGVGITLQHLEYPTDSATQNLGTNFILKALRG